MRFFESTRRVGLILVALVVMTACTELPDEGLGESTHEVLTTNLTTYMSGQDVIVNYTGMSGAPTDWITLAVPSSPGTDYEEWLYTGGGTSGSVTFTGLTLPAGMYVARGYYDWAGTSSYQVQQTSAPFAITGGNPPTVTTDMPSYPAGATVTVSYANMPGNQNDWVAVAVAGSPVTSYVQWSYTNGTAMGSQAFSGLAPGNYEARAYRDNTYSLLASSTFSVATSPTVSTDQTAYNTGQVVEVRWSNLPGNATDYVAVALAGSPDSTFLAMASTGGATTGSAPFAGLAAGSYEARAYSNGTLTVIARSTFTITDVGMPTVTTDATSYMAGQTVTVTYSGMPGNSGDWVAISTAGSPDTSFVTWTFTNGTSMGSLQFTNLPGGTYEARGYAEGTFTVLDRSPSFTVAGGGGSTCTPGAMPVLGSLASGELVIAADAQTATAPLAVNLATSVLFVSMRENEGSPNNGAVICTLHGEDLVVVPPRPAGITCGRNDIGTDTPGGNGIINIRWSVATFTSGVTVQRGEANTGGTNPLTVPLTSIDPNSSFVLLGGQANGGGAWGSNEFTRAEILNGTTLDLRNSTNGTYISWQVVTMIGASVQRGSASFASGDTVQTVPVTAVAGGGLALTSYTSDNQVGIAASALMMQARLTSPTALELRRSAGGSALDVSWEVVSLPVYSSSGVSNFAVGQTTDTVAVAGVQSSSSVVIGSSQSVLGQSGGSTTFNGALQDMLGEAAATMSTSANAVTLQRSASTATASIPWTVIDFSRDCAGN